MILKRLKRERENGWNETLRRKVTSNSNENFHPTSGLPRRPLREIEKVSPGPSLFFCLLIGGAPKKEKEKSQFESFIHAFLGP